MDDITSFMNGWNQELEKVLKKLKMEVEEKGLKVSIAEGGKEGESKAITSCKYLEEKLHECSKKEGVALQAGVETLGLDQEEV